MHGRNGVEGLVQQGPVRRFLQQLCQAAICERTNVPTLPTACWFGLMSSSSLVILGGRRPSTIGRELVRNRPDSRRYHPFRTQKMAQKRRRGQGRRGFLKERFPGEKHRHFGAWNGLPGALPAECQPVPAGSARLLRSGRFSRRPRSRTKVKPRQSIADAMKSGDRPAHIVAREEAGH